MNLTKEELYLLISAVDHIATMRYGPTDVIKAKYAKLRRKLEKECKEASHESV